MIAQQILTIQLAIQVGGWLVPVFTRLVICASAPSPLQPHLTTHASVPPTGQAQEVHL